MFKRKVAYEEAQVLKSIRAGGLERRRAENLLFDRFAYLLPKGKKQHGLTEEEALEAYTEAVLALIQQVVRGDFRTENRVSTLLHQIYYYKCVDVFRKRTNTRVVDIDEALLAGLPDRAQDVLERMVAQEDIARLAGYMQQLGDSCRQVLWDSMYHGYSPAEIAEKMGFKNAETVMSQKSRCLKKLKGLLAHERNT